MLELESITQAELDEYAKVAREALQEAINTVSESISRVSALTETHPE